MAAALELHSSSAVLEAAARSFLSLSAEGPAWCSVAQATRDALVQRWVDHLRPLLEDSLVVCSPEQRSFRQKERPFLALNKESATFAAVKTAVFPPSVPSRITVFPRMKKKPEKFWPRRRNSELFTSEIW